MVKVSTCGWDQLNPPGGLLPLQLDVDYSDNETWFMLCIGLANAFKSELNQISHCFLCGVAADHGGGVDALCAPTHLLRVKPCVHAMRMRESSINRITGQIVELWAPGLSTVVVFHLVFPPTGQAGEQ